MNIAAPTDVVGRVGRVDRHFKSVFTRLGPGCLNRSDAAQLYLQEKTGSGDVEVRRGWTLGPADVMT